MGHSRHLWFLHAKQRLLDQNYKSLLVLDLTRRFEHSWLVPEILVSMGPSRHLWFLNAIQRLLDQNYKTLLVLDLTCRFEHAKQRD